MELLVQSGPDAGKVFQVGTNPLVVGRQAGTDILLNDGQASRRHASFELVNGTLLVSDLGSANGTQVNGQRLNPNQPRQLQAGDVVTIGGTNFVLRGEATPGPSPAVTQPAQSYQQAAPQPPAYNNNGPVPPQPGYNAAPPTYNQPPAYNAALPQQPPAQPYNQPPSAYGAPSAQAAGYNQSSAPAQSPAGYNQPGYNAPGDYGAIAPAYSQAPAAPGYGYAPPPPTAQPKKGNGGLLIGLGVIVVIAIAAVVGIIIIAGGGNPNPSNNNNGTPVAQVPTTPKAPPPPATVPVGQSGTNNVPPSPPAATTAAAPTPTPASQPKTPGSGTNNGNSGGATTGLGLTVTFPADWKTRVNENKNLIESDAPDGVTYSVILRIAGVKGAATDRLKKYIDAVTQDQPDLKVVQDIKAGEGSSQVADTVVTYTDQSDNLQHRDYVVAVANGSDDTYFMTFSTEDSKFESQSNTFLTIIRSIKL